MYNEIIRFFFLLVNDVSFKSLYFKFYLKRKLIKSYSQLQYLTFLKTKLQNKYYKNTKNNCLKPTERTRTNQNSARRWPAPSTSLLSANRRAAWTFPSPTATPTCILATSRWPATCTRATTATPRQLLSTWLPQKNFRRPRPVRFRVTWPKALRRARSSVKRSRPIRVLLFPPTRFLQSPATSTSLRPPTPKWTTAKIVFRATRATRGYKRPRATPTTTTTRESSTVRWTRGWMLVRWAATCSLTTNKLETGN